MMAGTREQSLSVASLYSRVGKAAVEWLTNHSQELRKKYASWPFTQAAFWQMQRSDLSRYVTRGNLAMGRELAFQHLGTWGFELDEYSVTERRNRAIPGTTGTTRFLSASVSLACMKRMMTALEWESIASKLSPVRTTRS